MPADAPSSPVQRQKTATLAVIHVLAIVLIWLAPFLFRWWLIVIGIGIYYLQIILLGDCVLTRWQFRTPRREMTFYYYLLTKLGFHPNKRAVRYVADFVMPPVIVAIALAWQSGLRHTPALW